MYPVINFGPLGAVPSYIVYLSVLYSCLLFYVLKRARKKNLTLNSIRPDTALDLALLIMVGGFIGARMMHVFYEEWDYYRANLWRIFQIWQGGFVFYGGFMGAMLTSFIYLKVKKQNFGIWLDFYAPVLALGYGLGRMSCFIAGCCYGRYCEMPWAVRFPFDHIPRHPTQLYAVIYELMVFVGLIFIEKKRFFSKKLPGVTFLFWLSAHAIGRLIMENYRDDFRGADLLGLSISTWLSLVLLSLSLTGLSFMWQQKPRT